MKLDLFIGIDVSKKTLNYELVVNAEEKLSFESENSIDGIKGFIKELKKQDDFDLSKAIFCMEYTGIYNNHLLAYLTEIKANIWLENPIHIKKSLGMVRGKNDKVDAARIAQFAYKNRDEAKLWEPERKIIQTLKAMTGIRNRIMKSMESLIVPIQEVKGFVDKETVKNLKNACKTSLNALKKDLKNINDKIIELIKGDEQLSYLFKLVSSVDNVGPVIATAVIVQTNEFKKFDNAKKFACYAGVAPFEHSSGTSIRGKTRVSHMANKSLKTLLHLAALGAVSRPGEMKLYFDRKVAEGKNKMLIINAIRNKIILRIFACVRQDKLFVKC
jgi:transposase